MASNMEVVLTDDINIVKEGESWWSHWGQERQPAWCGGRQGWVTKQARSVSVCMVPMDTRADAPCCVTGEDQAVFKPVMTAGNGAVHSDDESRSPLSRG